jgi:uncharacterized metal-binding protein YceD (DUF177 family)
MSQPEFSRPVDVATIPPDGLVRTIEAKPDELRDLARRLELVAIDRLSATLRLRRVHGGETIEVSGRIDADVVQSCVVTLDPVRNRVQDDFVELFAPAHLMPEFDPESEVDLAALESMPEPIEGGRIDLGEVVAQNLSLALDPYPRAPGVPFVGDDGEAVADGPPEESERRENPFSVLAKLKRSH